MTVPLTRMQPGVGGKIHDTISNNVVLPAPLGPMTALMWPVLTLKETRSSATRPPKQWRTFSASSSTLYPPFLASQAAPGSPEPITQRFQRALRRQGNYGDENGPKDGIIQGS